MVIDSLPGPRGGRVVVAGDWHGNTRWAMHVVERTAALGINVILQLGDLGVLWPGDRGNSFTFKLQRHLARHTVQLYFVDGNHDNHTALRALPRDPLGFGVVITQLKGGRSLKQVRWLPRGHRWTWPDGSGGEVRFGALGGAFSIDYAERTPQRDWWPRIEEVEPQDVRTLGNAPIDVLVSHDCPTGAVPHSHLQLDYDDENRSARSRDLLRMAVEATRPRLTLAGHWHQRTMLELVHDHASSATVVQVLNMDGVPGNWAVLDLRALELIEPELAEQRVEHG